MINCTIVPPPGRPKTPDYTTATAVDPTIFTSSRFLKDVESFCSILNAPFSSSTTQAVLRAYSTCINTGALGWRVTTKDSTLNYRLFQNKSADTIAIAIKANFIKPSPLTDLVQSWTMCFDGEVQQWCDFDTLKGLVKTWVFLGQTRNMEDVLDVHFVPNSIRRHAGEFRRCGLDRVRTLAVDWHSKTVNIYWRVPGPLTQTQADVLLGLAGCQPMGQAEVEEISRFSSAKDGSFAFAVTLGFESGEIERAGFYATKLSRGNLPGISDRLKIFLEKAPDYDPEEWITIAWGFGKDGRKYMKAEKSYCGRFVGKVKDMMTQDPNI
ncbi:prenyltransferase-like protein [Colletotrichum cereale]|nr:prenyltransferase-like protein [Colletotrichum cereale]